MRGMIASVLGCLLPGLASASAWAQLTDAEMAALESRLPPPAGEPIDFQRQVQPIFEHACLRCHGPERPKAQFRLDAREHALKGGSSGVAIVPGQSARSPMIYFVARLVEDMEMPPADKGEPLSAEQVGILRAWIDQGANWGGATNTSRIAFSVTPTVQWFTAKGNERLFREHTGLKDGWNGGAQHFLLEQQSGDRRFSLEGRVLPNPEEYRLRLDFSQRDLGFARFGFEQYREFYSDAGGYHPNLIPPSYRLDRDLGLDVGRAWTEFGLTLPNWPRLLVGYEFQYRDGAKSILQWGDVGTVHPDFDPFGTNSKKIFPASKEIDEQVHILKFDLAHEVAGIGVENQFRAEWYDNETRRETVGFYDLTRSGLDKNFQVREGHEHFQASDAFRLEKQVVDWLFLSGGYFFSRLDGNYSLNANPVFPTGDYFSWDRYYSAQSVILEQNTHVFNANAQLGPWAGFTTYAGVQSEWMSQRGFGDVDIFEGFPESLSDPAFARTLPAFVDSNLDRAVVEEHFGARYTAIPFTVLFAEGRFAQESIGQTEARTGDTVDFLRDTDASSQLSEGRVGFTVSPWTRASLTTQYKRRHKDVAYDHLIDEDLRRTAEGYSAFITGRESRVNELSTKLSVRPMNNLKIGLTYQLATSDYDNETMPIVAGFPGETSGGRVYAANYDAQIYSANVAWTPWHRLHLASTFSYRHTRTSTGHAIEPVVVSYEGDLYSSISTATFFLNQKTDLIAGYTYSWADFGQSNYDAGLPLGIVYDWHMVSAGVTRRLRKNISTNLQYRFYGFDQENAGGTQNYTAHGVLASLTMRLE
jgi:hypothetical protein